MRETLPNNEPVSGHYLSRVAFICGVAGIPLWLLSYVWIPFSLAGRETDVIMVLVVVGEVGAMVMGLSGIITGLMARKVSAHHTVEFKLATRGMTLGGVTCAGVVVLNLIGVFILS